jgi:hypothetical protein
MPAAFQTQTQNGKPPLHAALVGPRGAPCSLRLMYPGNSYTL